MFTIENPFLWLVGLPAIGILLFLLRGHFRAETRERRRGESHRPAVSQKNSRPLRAAAGKPERDRKR
jgi:hypothetical protein